MAHLLHGFSRDRLLLLAGGSSGPILPLLFFPRRVDAKVLSPGSRTCRARCRLHPPLHGSGRFLPPLALSGPRDLVRGLIKAPQALTSAAVLLLPAVRLLPCPPSLPPGRTEAQPGTRGVVSFFRINLHRSLCPEFSFPELFRW